MTIDEAIDIVKCLAWHARPDEEKIEQAIKTLEQEPCEDCISRKAVIDAIYANGVWENEYNLTSSRIKKAVESLPPVTPKPKTECSCEQIKWERDVAIEQLKELGYGLGEKPRTGHWIKQKVGWKCSNCDLCTNDAGRLTYCYCPRCGIRISDDKSFYASERYLGDTNEED